LEKDLRGETFSVCPICLKCVPAERIRVGGAVFLRKRCESHGPVQSVIWRGHADFDAWIGGAEAAPNEKLHCTDCSGLCPDHLQKTCCVLLEVTKRCNLACRFCFADHARQEEPPFAQVQSWLRELADPGKTLVQLSGGEPTLRDDLPDIIAAAKEAGCRHVQLNTNGIRLSADRTYLRALSDAGLSFVFMQFDGTTDAIYESLRGKPLLGVKRQAIENCAAENLGVTLVPTLVPDVNMRNIGEILCFGISEAPAVRGVHFQPVSYFGRFPAMPADDMRVTLDELLFEIEQQTAGQIRAVNLLPSRCDHPLCGFHGDFMVARDGVLVPLSQRGKTGAGCCSGPTTAEQSRAFVARRWQRPPRSAGSAPCGDFGDMETFLRRIQSHGFTVTAMAFQDAGNLDVERLRRCSLHVFDNGRFVPFCAHYLSGWRA